MLFLCSALLSLPMLRGPWVPGSAYALPLDALSAHSQGSLVSCSLMLRAVFCPCSGALGFHALFVRSQPEAPLDYLPSI